MNVKTMGRTVLINRSENVQPLTKKKTISKKVPNRGRCLYFMVFIILFLNVSEAAIEIQGEKSAYKYSTLDKIGEGGFATVYKGMDTETEANVAIKAIKKSSNIPKMSKILAAYRTEIQIMQKLNHPNIIQFIDQAETSGTLYIITELCSGGELLDKLMNEGKYDEKSALQLFRQLESGVEYLHTQDIVHRDLKPENIMFCNNAGENNTLKIIDFGFAYDDKKKQRRTPGETLNYTAPELMFQRQKDSQSIDMMKAADVWAMGVILYLCLSGMTPWSFNLSKHDLFRVLIKYTVNFSHEVWYDISDDTKDLVEAMLTVNPNDRVKLEDIYTLNVFDKVVFLVLYRKKKFI